MYELFSKKNYIEFIVISDLHLCNKLDRIDLLYKAYEYADKNKLKYVINLGDVFDSYMPHNKNDLKIKTLSKQVEYVIDNYPYSDTIKTLVLYGNHDYYSKLYYHKDIVKWFSDERCDLINLGYGENYINIKDNYVKLQHEIDYLKNYKKNLETYITLLGHYHNYKVRINDNNIYVYAPSLSDLKMNNVNSSILHIRIDFNNEMFSNINIKCVDIEKNIITSEFDTNINMKVKKHQFIKEKIKENL